MTDFTIYHNPRCSKSRQTLKLLENNGIEPTVITYLDNPPSAADIKKLLKQLDVSAHDLMRRKEAPYKELGLSANDDESILILAMSHHPILIERPIVSNGKRAVLGRPPENVMELIA